MCSCNDLQKARSSSRTTQHLEFPIERCSTWLLRAERKMNVDVYVSKSSNHVHVNLQTPRAMLSWCFPLAPKPRKRGSNPYSNLSDAELLIPLLLSRSDGFSWVPNLLYFVCNNASWSHVPCPLPHQNSKEKLTLNLFWKFVPTRLSNCGTTSPYIHQVKHDTPPYRPHFWILFPKLREGLSWIPIQALPLIFKDPRGLWHWE